MAYAFIKLWSFVVSLCGYAPWIHKHMSLMVKVNHLAWFKGPIFQESTLPLEIPTAYSYRSLVKWRPGPLVFFIVFCPFSNTISLYSNVSLSILPSTPIHIRYSTLWSCFCWAVVFTLVFALSTLHLSRIILFILILSIRRPVAFKSTSKVLARMAPRLEDISPLTNSRGYLGNLIRL